MILGIIDSLIVTLSVIAMIDIWIMYQKGMFAMWQIFTLRREFPENIFWLFSYYISDEFP